MSKETYELIIAKMEFILDKIKYILEKLAVITAICVTIGDFLTLILAVIALKDILQQD